MVRKLLLETFDMNLSYVYKCRGSRNFLAIIHGGSTRTPPRDLNNNTMFARLFHWISGIRVFRQFHYINYYKISSRNCKVTCLLTHSGSSNFEFRVSCASTAYKIALTATTISFTWIIKIVRSPVSNVSAMFVRTMNDHRLQRRNLGLQISKHLRVNGEICK
jgi:hypothetical protein